MTFFFVKNILYLRYFIKQICLNVFHKALWSMLVPVLTSSLEAYPQTLRCAASTTISTMSLATTSTASSRPIWTQAVPHLSEAILTPEAKKLLFHDQRGRWYSQLRCHFCSDSMRWNLTVSLRVKLKSFLRDRRRPTFLTFSLQLSYGVRTSGRPILDTINDWPYRCHQYLIVNYQWKILQIGQ